MGCFARQTTVLDVLRQPFVNVPAPACGNGARSSLSVGGRLLRQIQETRATTNSSVVIGRGCKMLLVAIMFSSIGPGGVSG